MSRIWIGRADTPLALLAKTNYIFSLVAESSAHELRQSIVGGRLTLLILCSAAAAAWDLRASAFCGGCEGRCWGLPVDVRGWLVSETKVCPPVWLDDLEQIDPICVFELLRCLFE